MFKRLANWLLRHSHNSGQSYVRRTDPYGNMREVSLTPEEAIVIEAIMNKKAGYFMIVRCAGKPITLVNDMDFDTLLGELRELANDCPTFKDELTNLVIDLNQPKQ